MLRRTFSLCLFSLFQNDLAVQFCLSFGLLLLLVLVVSRNEIKQTRAQIANRGRSFFRGSL
jgi:hypothetical protein